MRTHRTLARMGALATVALVVGLCATPSSSFSSGRLGRIGGPETHQDITEDVALGLGFTAQVAGQLRTFVGKPDWSEFFLVASCHMTRDRVSSNAAVAADSRAAARASIDVISGFRRRTIERTQTARQGSSALRALRLDEARLALGFGLHAIQDAYAHTNAIDLSGADRGAFRDALLGRVGADRLPQGLLVCSFTNWELGHPAGDAYPHDGRCKDAINAGYPEADLRMPNGMTKHAYAVDGARNASQQFLVGILNSLNAQERRLLQGR